MTRWDTRLAVVAAAAAAAAAAIAARWDPIGAQAWTPPHPLPTIETNRVLLDKGERILEGRVLGPESLAYDAEGGWVYTGTMDGRLVRFKPDSPEQTLETFLWLNKSCADLEQVFLYEAYDPALEPQCGRPLGLRMGLNRTLWVLDAYKGVLAVNLATRTVRVLYDGAKLANDLDVDGDLVFFSESSPRWGRNRIVLEILATRRTGRLMMLNSSEPHRGAHVLVDGVLLTNGVTLSHSKRSVLFVSGPAVHAYDRALGKYRGIVLDNLPCIPDNIRRHPEDGKTYLVSCGGRRAQPFSLTDALAPFPWLRELLVAALAYNQYALLRFVPVHSMVLKVELGRSPGIVASVQDPTGRFGYVSEAERIGDYLYIGTWKDAWISRVPWADTGF